MRFVFRLLLHVIANAVALYAAVALIEGFSISGDLMTLGVLGAILTVLNMVIRPIVKFFLGPFIILTFGLFIIVVNALMLWLLDFISANLTIQGYLPLLLATLLIGLVNIAFGLVGKAVGAGR